MLIFNIVLVSLYYSAKLCSAVDWIPPEPSAVELPKCDEKSGIHFNFSNTGTQRIPTSFLPSDTITCISLENNSISTVEDGAFEEFSRLQYLNLRNNKFLKKSKILDYTYPALETLILDNAREGDDSYMGIWFKFIAPNLEKVFLRFNNLISVGLYEISNLKELYLSNNKLTAFTISGNRTNLTHLDLANNALSFTYLNQLPNLQECVLNNNQFARIGNKGCDYNCEHLGLDDNWKLEKLFMKNNIVARIASDSLKTLVSLRYFDLSFNRLKEVAENEFTNLMSIQTLVLDHNQLPKTPNFSGLTNLEHLLLNHNAIQEIGKDVFKNLPQLKILKLNNNQLKEIAVGTFEDMPLLKELDLSNNELTTCADGWLSQLPSLRVLPLNNNKFDDVEKMSFYGVNTDLQYINMLNNPFKNITMKSIMYLSPKTVIDLK